MKIHKIKVNGRELNLLAYIKTVNAMIDCSAKRNLDNNRNDRPARLTALCGVHFYERCLYIFALTSMSLRDCPLL